MGECTERVRRIRARKKRGLAQLADGEERKEKRRLLAQLTGGEGYDDGTEGGRAGTGREARPPDPGRPVSAALIRASKSMSCHLVLSPNRIADLAFGCLWLSAKWPLRNQRALSCSGVAVSRNVGGLGCL